MTLLVPDLGSVTYYVPSIPDIPGTARYQHALAITNHADVSKIISNEEIPETIRDKANQHSTIPDSSALSKAHSASSEFKKNPSDLFFTTFHYETAVAGMLATSRNENSQWIVDVYDSPVQYRLNSPWSHHSIGSRVLEQLLGFANHAIITGHPQNPGRYGNHRSYLDNGTPVDLIRPDFEKGDRLRVVWVGSPRMDRGGQLLVDALHQTKTSVNIDVYGEKHSQLESGIQNIPDKHKATHHGKKPYGECLEAVSRSDVGYCVLPARSDWLYAHPIKLGEYLAGGTVPIASNFPGMMQVGGKAAYYVSPDAKQIATALDEISSLPEETYVNLAKCGRSRAESRSWSQVRSQLATQLSVAQTGVHSN